MEMDSSEDEGVVVKRRSARQKIMESDDEAAKDTDILKLCNSISSAEPDTEQSRDLVEETVHGEVDTYEKKKKWKILLDGDCSLDEETPSGLLTVAKNTDGSDDEEYPRHSVRHGPASCFSLAEKSDLYDAEGCEDEQSLRHSVGHGPLSHFSLMKESDLYDAEGSEDEAAPRLKSTGKSKPKGRSLSERKTKVSGV
jgi:hypothetical protein